MAGPQPRMILRLALRVRWTARSGRRRRPSPLTGWSGPAADWTRSWRYD